MDDIEFICNDCDYVFDVSRVEIEESIDYDEDIICPECGSPDTEELEDVGGSE